MANEPTVVGLGEILWDLLPSGRQLGGAPANFAYSSHILGNRGVIASRVGDDQLGEDIRDVLKKAKIDDRFLQRDSSHPTGTVNVEIDNTGQPRFEITQPVAWDFLEWTGEWRELAQSADAVCFGTLAQRSAESHTTILQFLKATRPTVLRIFDVNLRQQFYSREIIRESLTQANVVKLNNDEVPKVAELFGINIGSEASFARSLMKQFNLKLVSVTRGARGSLLCNESQVDEHLGFRTTVKDTIGAGDAFTAGLVYAVLHGRPLPEINDLANRMGAWTASNSGGMPEAPKEGIRNALQNFAQ
ncbi:MAG TPA: carbohydrate kinase [Terriglobales bacterium]|nr:carbohydrate kinase [Terriglobales bacterium]